MVTVRIHIDGWHQHYGIRIDLEQNTAGMTVLQTFGEIGVIIVISNVAVLCETLFWGESLLLRFSPTWPDLTRSCFRRKGLKSRLNLVMLIATVIMFISASMQLALDIFSLMVVIQGALIDQSIPNLDSRLVAVTKITSSFVSNFLDMINSYFNGIESGMFQFMLSDMIVVWRAWTLCSENRKLMVGPLLTLLGSIATAIASMGVQTKVLLKGSIRLGQVAGALQYASWALSLATNLATTSLIGYKAWKHRQSIKDNLGQGNSRTKVEKIMALLVESGGIYCIFWITLLVTNFVTIRVFGRPHSVTDVIVPNAVQLAGIYPTVILVLVSLEKTIWDSRGSVVESIGGNSAHMEFAPGPGIVSKTTASRHQISVIQLDTGMQSVDFERDDYRDSIKASV
ncbi:hypothetical protein HETIRDRAFT_116888 [Heterobasidion irregulare TC 32-1]|uniref:Uncharacterized protein n=1 Tax=Heterobasidion irregulare (strain TC 32-1) TaxID=747525 RepID=W4KI31_HETIT|nr:uncharacterized protein HETIRDRAFT_116888 [Heterobasidion irregulare TC 32-1]ETW84731.1 hypothetical protein HETIRDRAFT_116888 [Heterobasidion irregulare TC 32-1]